MKARWLPHLWGLLTPAVTLSGLYLGGWLMGASLFLLLLFSQKDLPALSIEYWRPDSGSTNTSEASERLPPASKPPASRYTAPVSVASNSTVRGTSLRCEYANIGAGTQLNAVECS